MLAFAKYLDHENYDVSIITISPDKHFHEDVEYQCTIYRLPNHSFLKVPEFTKKTSKVVHYFKVAKKLIVLKLKKNEYERWSKLALKKLVELDNEKKIDVLISSFAPAAPMEVCSKFKDTNEYAKWIVDMRDEMSQNPSNSEFLKDYYSKLEGEINNKAVGLVAVSLPIVNYFKELMPNLTYFEEVRNGYDDTPPSFPEVNEKFTITYAGTFYGSRKPDTFFKALEQLIKSEDLLVSKLQIRFIGTPLNFTIPSVLQDAVEVIGRVSQEESMNYMAKSDVNLLVQPSWGRKGVFTGKIFDYIAVKKPILGLLDLEDVAAQLIKEEDLGIAVDFSEINEIKVAILSLYSRWKKGKITLDTSIEKHHRKEQVSKLNDLINKVVS